MYNSDKYFHLLSIPLSLVAPVIYWLSHHLQIDSSQYERSPLNSKGINVVNGTSVNNGGKPLGIKIGSSEMLIEGEDVRVSSTDANERAVNISSFLGISTDTVNKDKSFEKLSSISTPTETQGYPRKSEQATMTLDKKKSLEISDGASILDKIFNTAINLNSGDSSNMKKVSFFLMLCNLARVSLELKILLT